MAILVPAARTGPAPGLGLVWLPRTMQALYGPSRAGSGRSLDEGGHRNRPRLCDRHPQRLDALDLVHGLRSEVRRSTGRTRPHGDALYDKQVGGLPVAARDMFEMNLLAAAGLTEDLSRRRR